MMLDPSLIWEDSLCYHDETLQGWPQIHDEIGLENCVKSAKRSGQCKDLFRINFSEQLVQKYAQSVGIYNEYGDRYWRGKEAYARVTAEDYFYTAFNLSKNSKKKKGSRLLHQVVVHDCTTCSHYEYC